MLTAVRLTTATMMEVSITIVLVEIAMKRIMVVD
jgi:hypothetical protein